MQNIPSEAMLITRKLDRRQRDPTVLLNSRTDRLPFATLGARLNELRTGQELGGEGRCKQAGECKD